MTDLTVSIRVNNDLRPDEYVAVATLADQAGFDQLWVSNDLMRHSSLALLPMAAARTSRLGLGIGILNPYTIHPAEMAMFFSTLDAVAPNRLLLGIGAGAEDFLGWVGLARDRPLQEVESAVAALRYLFHQTGTIPDGWDPDAPRLPIIGRIPLYVGAMSPQMLRLAGRIGDGVLPLLFPPERYVEAREWVLDGAGEREVDIAACVWCSIDPDAARAQAALASRIAYYGPSFSAEVLGGLGLESSDLLPARQAVLSGNHQDARRLLPEAAMGLGIAGSARTIVERCQGLIGMGARHISFGPPLGPETMVAVEALGSQVIPNLT